MKSFIELTLTSLTSPTDEGLQFFNHQLILPQKCTNLYNTANKCKKTSFKCEKSKIDYSQMIASGIAFEKDYNPVKRNSFTFRIRRPV